MSNGEMSGLFFHQQPQEVIKFGAGEMARQKRQLSASLDLEKMLSSPVKFAAVGRRNLTLRKCDGHEQLKRQAENESDPEDGNILDDAEDHSDASAGFSQLESSVGAESFERTTSSPLRPQTVPVNFNDST
ncbi:MAG: hypothetical protein M1823_008221, partial [Watsoniomyces obsoletus]